MDIIKKHYEKVVLGVLLLSFVIALVYLLQIMSSTHGTNTGNSAAAKNILVIQRENMPYKFNYVNENFSLDKQDVTWKERTGNGLIGYGQPGLAVPVKALRCAHCKKIIPWAQLRKNESRCPFEACSQDLNDPGEPEEPGIPDGTIDFTAANNIAYGKTLTHINGHYYSSGLAPAATRQFATDGNMNTWHAGARPDE